jgi:hypothetical protein
MRGRSLSMAALALVSCLAVPVSSADAQLTSLIPGVRARIRAPGSINGRVTGTVTNRSADSLSLAMESGVPVQIPLSAITAVDISKGKSRSKGAMKGALWGGAISLPLALIPAPAQEDCTSNCTSRAGYFAFAVPGFALTGALIGAFVQSESWERLDVPARVALLPTRGGTMAVVSIRF